MSHAGLAFVVDGDLHWSFGYGCDIDGDRTWPREPEHTGNDQSGRKRSTCSFRPYRLHGSISGFEHGHQVQLIDALTNDER